MFCSESTAFLLCRALSCADFLAGGEGGALGNGRVTTEANYPLSSLSLLVVSSLYVSDPEISRYEPLQTLGSSGTGLLAANLNVGKQGSVVLLHISGT